MVLRWHRMLAMVPSINVLADSFQVSHGDSYSLDLECWPKSCESKTWSPACDATGRRGGGVGGVGGHLGVGP